MMIIKQRKDDDYCIVHGVIHNDTRLYEICDYCLKHERWMYPRTVYYRHGFAKKDVLMCNDCQKIERQHFESRLTTHVTEHKAYEAICEIIKKKTTSTSTASSSSNSFLLHENNKASLDNKEKGNRIIVIDYYDAVRIAYQNSTDLREYLNHYTLREIDKDLKILWKFIYRMLYFEKRIKVVNKDVDNLLVYWITMK